MSKPSKLCKATISKPTKYWQNYNITPDDHISENNYSDVGNTGEKTKFAVCNSSSLVVDFFIFLYLIAHYKRDDNHQKNLF